MAVWLGNAAFIDGILGILVKWPFDFENGVFTAGMLGILVTGPFDLKTEFSQLDSLEF